MIEVIEGGCTLAFFASFERLAPWVQAFIATSWSISFAVMVMSVCHLLRALLVFHSIRRLTPPLPMSPDCLAPDPLTAPGKDGLTQLDKAW